MAHVLKHQKQYWYGNACDCDQYYNSITQYGEASGIVVVDKFVISLSLIALSLEESLF
jgi:hypothetical protein